MTLVGKIYGNSPISNWFATFDNATNKIVDNTNETLEKCPQPNKYKPSIHRGLLKAAAVYISLKHIGYINSDQRWLQDSYTYAYATKMGLNNELLEYPTNSIREQAMQALLMGAFDISYRNHKEHALLKPFIQAWRQNQEINLNNTWLKEWDTTIAEAIIITGNIARCYNFTAAKGQPVIPNPHFDLSHHVGGANGDFIIGNMLVNAVVNTKMTRHNFNELIAYLLMNVSNSYKIKHLLWTFPLLQTSIILEVDKLLKDLANSRKLFREMVESNYELDEFNTNSEFDDMDLFKFSNPYC